MRSCQLITQRTTKLTRGYLVRWNKGRAQWHCRTLGRAARKIQFDPELRTSRDQPTQRHRRESSQALAGASNRHSTGAFCTNACSRFSLLLSHNCCNFLWCSHWKTVLYVVRWRSSGTEAATRCKWCSASTTNDSPAAARCGGSAAASAARQRPSMSGARAATNRRRARGATPVTYQWKPQRSGLPTEVRSEMASLLKIERQDGSGA